MAEEKVKKKREPIYTPEFRVSYPYVFEPRLNDMNEKEKLEYSVVAVFAPDADLSGLKKAAAAAMKEKWGDKKPKNLRSPFRKCDEREDEESGEMPEGYEKGGHFMNLRSTQQPGVLNRKAKPILDAEEFYAGCYAIATVSCYAYEFKNKQGAVMSAGVGFGLNNLQKTRDGDPLTTRRKAEDEFKAIEGGDDDEETATEVEEEDPFA